MPNLAAMRLLVQAMDRRGRLAGWSVGDRAHAATPATRAWRSAGNRIRTPRANGYASEATVGRTKLLAGTEIILAPGFGPVRWRVEPERLGGWSGCETLRFYGPHPRTLEWAPLRHGRFIVSGPACSLLSLILLRPHRPRCGRCGPTSLHGRFSITLSPLVSPSVGVPRVLTDVYGPGVAVCARPALEADVPDSRHRHTRDVMSARPVAVAADTPVICSAGGTDPTLLALLREGGLPVGTDLREFRSEAQFGARVTEAIDDGWLMSMEYPQPITLCPNEHAVKSARLVGYLNNKASITTLVDPRFQAHRTVVSRERLAEATPVEKSWVLKAATNDAHGASLDVYLHRAGEHITLPAFTQVLSDFVVEEYLRIRHNWGIQLYIAPDATARLLAITEQRIDTAGVYTGGIFGLVIPPPPELLTECVAIAQRAADLGYRGLCSLDCAETQEGQLVMLDLNFRITSGSIPLLALQSVRPDTLDRPAESVKLTVAAPLTELLTELHSALVTGDLLITGGHDTTRTDNPIKQSTLQLLVFGDDPHEVTARRNTLETTISG